MLDMYSGACLLTMYLYAKWHKLLGLVLPQIGKHETKLYHTRSTRIDRIVHTWSLGNVYHHRGAAFYCH